MKRPERLTQILRCVRRTTTAALLAVAVVMAYSSGWLAPLTHWLSDLRFSATRRPAGGKIVLVEIDPQSLDALGVRSRRFYDDLIRALDHMDPAAVALDVDLDTASTESDDAAFELALREAGGRTILATRRFTGSRQNGAADVPGVLLARFRAYASPALVNVQPDPDGVVRSVPFGNMVAGEPVPSLAALLAGAEWADRSFRVDWSIDPASFDRISAIDLVKGRMDPNRIAGRSVIVGATAGEPGHLFQVPGYGDVSSALVQAIAADTLLQGRALGWTGLPLTALGAEFLAILLVAVHGRLRSPVALIALGYLSLAVEMLAALVQYRMAVIVDTSAWQLLLFGAAAVTAASVLDPKRIWSAIVRASNGNSQELVAR